MKQRVELGSTLRRGRAGRGGDKLTARPRLSAAVLGSKRKAKGCTNKLESNTIQFFKGFLQAAY